MSLIGRRGDTRSQGSGSEEAGDRLRQQLRCFGLAKRSGRAEALSRPEHAAFQEAGDNNDFDGRRFISEPLQQLEPVGLGHVEIEDDEFHAFTMNPLKREGSGSYGNTLVSSISENAHQECRNLGFVINNEDSRRNSHSYEL